MMPEICDNEIDDDGDGLIDCYDPDCSSFSACQDFFVTSEELDPCNYEPPVVDSFGFELVFITDSIAAPIDQRSGVMVGDMDGDGIAELVGKDNNPARIHIYSGLDGTVKQTIVTGNNHPFSQTCIADVDRDGLGDIFITEGSNQLARYEFGNAAAVWKTANNIGTNSTHTTPQVADFNHDGIPEVYVGKRIFNALTGVRLAIGTGSEGLLVNSGSNNRDKFSIAYDVFQPGDNKPTGGVFGAEAEGLELIAGNMVYTVEIGSLTTQDASTLTVVSQITGGDRKDGFTSIADVDGDNEIDIVLMSAGKIYVWNPRTQSLIGDIYNLPSTSGGGRINVGDFDNDGMGRNRYSRAQSLCRFRI